MLTFSLLFLSGCWDMLEIDRRGLYTALGFDLTPDGRIKISAQFPLTETFTRGRATKRPEAIVITATGRTPWEAHAALESRTQVRACLCQLKVVVIGEKLARQGIFKVLDLIDRTSKYDRQLVVLIAKDAEAVLRAKPSQYPVSSLFIWSFYKVTGVKQQVTLYMPLWRLLTLLRHPSLEAVLPCAEVHGSDLYLRGLALFKDDHLITCLSPRESRGLLWTRLGRGLLAPHTQVKVGTLDVPLPGQPDTQVSLGFLKSKGKAKVFLLDGQPAALLEVQVSGEVAEESGRYKRLEEEGYKKIEEQAAELIRREIADALSVCQEKNVDAFELAETFRAAYPQEWSRQIWEEKFPTLTVEARVQVHLKKSGLLW